MRWIGAVLVLSACGYFGFYMAASHKKDENTLLQIISAIQYMECELQFRLTPLPQLLKQAAGQIGGIAHKVFIALAAELESQILTDVANCMETVLQKQSRLPQCSEEMLRMLGRGFGKFELQGQLKELESVRTACERCLAELEANRDVRLRSYQTLGLCAGAALAILLL